MSPNDTPIQKPKVVAKKKSISPATGSPISNPSSTALSQFNQQGYIGPPITQQTQHQEQKWHQQPWAIITVIAAGIVGYFSAIFAVKEDVNEIKVGIAENRKQAEYLEKEFERMEKSAAEMQTAIDQLAKSRVEPAPDPSQKPTQ